MCVLQEYNSSLFMFALYYIYFALVLTELVLHSFAERLGRHGYQFLGQVCRRLASGETVTGLMTNFNIVW